MENPHKPLQLDLEQILADKNPRLPKMLPGFVIGYLKRITHQDGINGLLRDHAQLRGFAFNEAVLGTLGIKYQAHGLKNIPAGGRNIFVSNHPLGGLDGMVFLSELGKHFAAVKFPVNDILLYLENYAGIFLPVNKHGALGREAARLLEEAYVSDCQILNFPAGLCSRKIRGKITDLTWQKSFIVKAIQHQRDIVPCFFSGRNSNFFYNLSLIRNFFHIKANLEMLYLVDEMYRQKGKEIDLFFGEPVPWQTFDKSKSPQEWADWVRCKTYDLQRLASTR
ncbi:MAG TPA: 1-acyl-sn-glycerol-3-phosphate acyltransferase [Bacteroidales bacterium]|nr:1-acyl-sn-glycerol-3-phosphate acyltransferase [Bacteroidales bacterium]